MKYKNKHRNIFDYTTSDFESDQSEHQLIQNKFSKQMTKNKQSLNSQSLHPDINVKEYFLYHPEAEFRDLSSYFNNYVGFYVDKKYCFPKYNQNLRQKKPIYGTEYYYYKSDIVLMMFHSDMLKLESLKDKKIKGFSFICQINKRKNFKDSTFNGITSEKLNGQDKDGFTLKPIRLLEQENFGSERMLFYTEKLIFRKKKITKSRPIKKKKTNPLSLYKWRFNKLNELSLNYSLETLADKSKKHEEHLSFLLDEYLMILELLNGNRFEISLNKIFNSENGKKEMIFKFSEITPSNIIDKNYFTSNNMNLPEKNKKVLYDDLKWNEFVWDSSSLIVRTQEYKGVDTFFFLKKNDIRINEEVEEL